MNRNSADISRFCIVTLPRSGSSYLGSRIQAFDNTIYHSEVFAMRRIQSGFRHKGPLDRLAINPLIVYRNLAPFSFIEWFFRRSLAENPDMVAFGFKLFVYHNDRALRGIVADGRYRIILLLRANKLAQYGSDKLARRTKAWSKAEEKRGMARQVAFDAAEFDAYCRRMGKHETYARSLLAGRAFLDVEYRQIDSRFAEIMSYIGGTDRLGSEDVSAHIEKQHTGTDLDRFSNPDAVLRHLRGTPWAEAADLGA